MPLKLYRLLRNRSTFILISLICFLLIQLSLYRRRHRVSKLKTRERFLLRQACRLLPADLWPSFLLIVQPQTLVRWHDSLWNLIHRLKSIIGTWLSRKRAGRPLQYREIIRILKQIVPENPLWGTVRIQSELMHLGHAVPLTTLRRYIKRLFPQDPRLIRLRDRWKTFLKNQATAILAMDFFTI